MPYPPQQTPLRTAPTPHACLAYLPHCPAAYLPEQVPCFLNNRCGQLERAAQALHLIHLTSQQQGAKV